MDLPLSDIITTRQAHSDEEHVNNVLKELKRFPNDKSTGLAIREMISLSPYNGDRALLVLKAEPPMLEGRLAWGPPGLSEIPSPPTVTTIPTPSFKPKVAAVPPLPDSTSNTPEMSNTNGPPRAKMKGGSKSTTVGNISRYQPHMVRERQRSLGPQNLRGGKSAACARPRQLSAVSSKGGCFGKDTLESVLDIPHAREQQKYMQHVEQQYFWL